MVEKVVIELTLEQQKALKGLKQLEVSSKKAEQTVSKSFSGMSSAVSSFVGNLAAIGAAKALGFLKDQVFGVVAAASELEVYETQFETFLKSADRAREHLQDLQQFAATTPFQLPGIADASKKLLAFGVEQEDIISTLEQLGNAAAATNNPIQDLALIFGQVQAAGKLTGERFLQLAERGINVGPIIAKSMGVAEKSLEKLRSEGKITAEIFNNAFKDMTTEGGKFAGGMIRQSKTVQGVFSTLSDNFFLLQAEVGKTILPQIKEAAIQITLKMQEFAKEIKENGPLIAKQFKDIADGAFKTASVMSSVAKALFEISAFAASGSIGEDIAESFNARKVSELDDTISNLKTRIGELQTEIQDRASGNQGFFSSIFDQRTSEELEEKLSSITRKMATLRTERNTLSQGEATIFSDEEINKGNSLLDESLKKKIEIANKEKEIKNEELAGEAEFQEKIAEIKASARLIDEELRLSRLEQDELNRELGFEALQGDLSKEQQIKIQAAENEIADERKKGLAIAKIRADQSKINFAAQKSIDKQLVGLKTQTNQLLINGAFTLGNEIARASSASAKTQFVISKTLAIAQATIAAFMAESLALASPPGPPWTIPVAAAAFTKGMVNVGIIAGTGLIQSFANGGIVDFGSTPSATDNQIANVASGEMVLTSDDQVSLLEGIRSGFGNNNNNITVIEIDGIEVARAMREAQTDGARL